MVAVQVDYYKKKKYVYSMSQSVYAMSPLTALLLIATVGRGQRH